MKWVLIGCGGGSVLALLAVCCGGVLFYYWIDRDIDPGPQNERLTDEQVAAMAKKYDLLPTRENVEMFILEVGSYKDTSVGPDVGTEKEIKQVQTVLRALGYDIELTGTFDDKTAAAVIDFKTKHGMTQSYKFSNGEPAINEYVDKKAAEALVAALKAKEEGRDRPTGDAPQK